MKFTKFLVLLLALSMLLVSCGGNGDGTVTTKPDGSTVTPPEPSDAHEYVKYGDELIDLFGFEGMGLYILEPIWYYPSDSVSHMKEVYSSGKNAFIIQFTATDYAEATEVPDYGDLPETQISGTVDKIYAAGEQCSFNEGDVIDLVSHYGLVKTDGDELSLMGYTEFTVIFRKGYSYIVAGLYLDGKYEASPDTFELSSHEDHKAFYNRIGIFEEDEKYGKWAFEYRKYRLDEVLRNFPPVDPTKPDDSTVNPPEPSGTTETPSTTEPGTKPSDSDFAKLNVTEAYSFSEGLAFIRVGDRQYELLCINKDGNVEFKIENPDKSAKLEVVIGFCNGIAALDVGAGDGSVILCKKDGTVIDPATVGGDTFVVRNIDVNVDMFRDGYVIVRKNSADYNITKGIFAVVDSKMETVLDFSDEFTGLFASSWGGLIYFADHLYTCDYDSFERCYDIKAGTDRYGQANEVFLSTMKIDTDRYTRISSSICYYDITNMDTVLLKFDDSQNVKWCDAFNRYGYAPIVMTLEDANGAQSDCFTVIDGQGKYAFDPIKLKNGFTFDNTPFKVNYIRNEGNLFIMRTYSENGYCVTVFDQNGVVGELAFEFEQMPSSFNAYLSDGVVLVSVVDSQGNYSATYYEPDFDKIL